MSHTPGPWEIARYSNYEGYSISAEKRGCIAERWYPTELDEQDNAEMVDNARLIAAAPEMLKVLQEISEWADDRADIDWNDHPNNAMQVQSLLGQIVAKATGK